MWFTIFTESIIHFAYPLSHKFYIPITISPGYYGHSKRYKKTMVMVTKKAKFWGVNKVHRGQMRLIRVLDYRWSSLKVRGLGGKNIIFLTCLQFSEQVQAVHTNELYELGRKQLLLHVQSEKRLSKEIKINRSFM